MWCLSNAPFYLVDDKAATLSPALDGYDLMKATELVIDVPNGLAWSRCVQPSSSSQAQTPNPSSAQLPPLTFSRLCRSLTVVPNQPLLIHRRQTFYRTHCPLNLVRLVIKLQWDPSVASRRFLNELLCRCSQLFLRLKCLTQILLSVRAC